MKFILGTKQHMTQYFDEDGRAFAATLVSAGPVKVVALKNADKDGYESVQVAYGNQKKERVAKPQSGLFKDMGSFRHIKEYRLKNGDKSELAVGDTVDASVFATGDKVTVTAVSKGKGFQGVVKRHGFSGVGMATHGQHNRLRAPGSVGACSYPAKVFKGTRMAGQMGNERVTVQNLQVIKVMPEHNLLLVKGSVPGAKGSIVLIEK